jgi:Sen15 protein
LQCHQNETLNVVYLTGRLEGRLNDDLFIPLETTQTTTMKEIVRIQEQLLEFHGVKRFFTAIS